VRNTAGIRHYFTEAFTPCGYISMLPELLRDTIHRYILTGGPGTGKSTMIKLIGIQLIDRGYDVDYIRSLRETDSVAGLYLSKQKLCLLDENEFIPHTMPKKEYYREISFRSYCRQSKLEEHQVRIKHLEEILLGIEQEIICRLKEDYPIGSQDENTFISLKSILQMNNSGATSSGFNEVTEILSKVKKDCLSFCFLHALQLDGWLNLAPKYIKDFDRICLEGRDSSNMLVDILQEVRFLGQVVEIIVNPLNPSAILGIIFPEKNLAVWKGNPSKIEEQGFKKKHSDELTEILEDYKTARIELKSHINDTVNFRGIDDLRSELLSSILSDLREKEGMK